MTTRSLTSREDYAYIHLGSVHLAFFRLEFDVWHSVSVREQFLNFFLVCYRLCSFSFYNLESATQSLRKFWLV